MKHQRVKSAYQEKEQIVEEYFRQKQLNYEGYHMFIRAFKKEETLEVWIKEGNKSNFILLKSYDFCSSSGHLGPKRKEGDGQIPEGIYFVNHFNPLSSFHLSLGINYPNKSDRMLGDRNHPGSAIYIHGNCVTIGCIPITDDKIKELYVLSVEAINNGQTEIPVHIFPSKLDREAYDQLKKTTDEQQVHAFWANLQTIYTDFDAQHVLKKVGINGKGDYYLTTTYY